MSEYNLTIFDLVEGEEYLNRYMTRYRIKNKILEYKDSNNSWKISTAPIVIKFQKIIKKETITFYRHFYNCNGQLADYNLACSNWTDSNWEKYVSNLGFTLIHTDTREFEINNGE